MEEITVNDFQTICRACLCDCNNIIAFNLNGSITPEGVAGDIISKYDSIPINQEDLLPKRWCKQCFEDFTACRKFMDKYKKSEKTILASQTSGVENQKYRTTRNLLKYKEKTHKCSFCDKSYTSKRNLINHERSHITEQPHICFLCEKRFSEDVQLKEHFLEHSQCISYKCSFCDRHFALKEDLTVHTRTHTGEKPPTCNICNERFTTKGTLKSHLWVHLHETQKQILREVRRPTVEESYNCGVCDDKFFSRTELKRHLEQHLQNRFNRSAVDNGNIDNGSC